MTVGELYQPISITKHRSALAVHSHLLARLRPLELLIVPSNGQKTMVQGPISVCEVRTRRNRLRAVDHPTSSVCGEEACAVGGAVERIVGSLVVAEPAIVTDKAAVVVRICLACRQVTLRLVPEGNIPATKYNISLVYNIVRWELPGAKPLDCACVEVMHGVIEPAVLDMAYKVPLPNREFRAKPLHKGLIGRRGKDEVWGGSVIYD